MAALPLYPIDVQLDGGYDNSDCRGRLHGFSGRRRRL